jgi:hypothetical protein
MKFTGNRRARSRNSLSSKSAAAKQRTFLSGNFESLEVRSMLAADSDISQWTNPTNRLDVDGNGSIQPADLLHILDDINRFGARALIASAQSGSTSGGMLTAQSLSSPSSDESDAVKTQYLDVSGDGLVTPQDALFVAQALNDPPPSAIFDIRTLDLAGNEISTITQGEYFLVQATVQDIRNTTEGPDFEGVFSAYMDVAFNASLASVASSSQVRFDPAFDNGQEADFSTPGLINEIGALTLDPVPGQNEQTVFYVVMQANAQGSLVFTPQFATGLGHQVLLFGDADEPLAASDIQFNASSALNITAPSAAAKPNITINDMQITEGNSGTQNLTFTVTLSNNNYDVQVSYATADGTATNNPPSGPRDYNATSGVLTFVAGGATTQNITVQVRGDTVAESSENFFVNLFSGFNGNITDAQGVGTINDNDSAGLTLSIGSPAAQNEGNAGNTSYTFPVTLSGNPASTVTVVFGTANGSATTADGDYAAANGTLTFTPGGLLTQNVTVNVIGDTRDEDNETFSVNLSSPTGATIATGVGTGTINDDDAPPTISIGDRTLAEGNSGTTNFTFPVTLSAASGKQITVVYTTSNGSATSPGDYAATTGTLTFAPGETSKNVTIAVVGDTAIEANETFNVTLSNLVNVTAGDLIGLGTITNDDAAPVSFSISGVSSAEGNAGTSVQNFVVTLSQNPTAPVTVTYNTSNGTATTGDSDYAAVSGTLTFNPGGPLTQNIAVTINGDTRNEANETYTVTLSNPTGGSAIGTASATGTITNDDAPPTVSIGDRTLAEGNSGTTNFSFPVTLSAASGQQITVVYTTSNGSATSPGDYAPTTGTLTFAPGETSKNVTVAVAGDTTFEGDETFNVTLSNLVNASAGDLTGVGSITNDDAPPVPSFSISGASSSEGNSGTSVQNFVVTLSQNPAAQVTVTYATSNGSATTGDNDYVAASGTLTFNPGGPLTQNIPMTINGDTRNEANETYTVTLSNPTGGSAIGTASAIGTINNDDAIPALTIGDRTLAEGNSGNTSFSFPVTLSAASGQQVTVVYATSNGTATTADGDYAATNGTLTFAPGETTKNITVNVAGDTRNEANESFNVTLSGVTNSSISDGSGLGTITNDDPAPNLSIANVSLTEGNSGSKNFGFNVTLDAASGQQVTVVYATANNSATAGSDYTAANGTLTFAPGETSKTINVAVLGDTTSENNETFSVNLSGPTNANVATSAATGEIINDDAPPGLSINDVTQNEGNSGTTSFTFTVSLAQASGVPVTVQFATGDGTAAAGSDYTATNGTLTFAPGETSKTITVSVLGNAVNEANETFNVTLSNASGGTPISIPTGIGTIVNDDAITVSISPSSVTEGNAGSSNMDFNVSLSGPSDQTVAVVYQTSAGGTNQATSGVDFTATSGTLTFNPGETSRTVSVAVTGDSLDEENEQFAVQLLNPTVATLGASSALGTINDDDDPPTIFIGDVSQVEGNGGGFDNFVFTVTLSAPSAKQITANFATANGTAVSPGDYTATSGVITFAAGETSKTISVPVRRDIGFESDENFLVNLTGVVNAAAGDLQATGTIQNDDPEGSVDFSTISGRVWIDTDGGGDKDAGEKYLSGVTVKLDGESLLTGEIETRTVTTDANGYYLFEEVEPGSYEITEVQPGLYLSAGQYAGSEGGTPGDNSIHVDLTVGGAEATDYNFTERGLRPEFISKRLMIASSFGAGQGLLSSLNLSNGDAWVSLDEGISGTMTLQADGNGSGTTTLTLYNSSLQQVASQTSSDGDLRVDWTGVVGAPYFVRVSGSNQDVDLRITNMIDVAAGILTIHGTDGDDEFIYDASGSVHTFTVNGVKYEINPNNVTSVVFDGGRGNDHVELIDSAFDDSLTAEDDWLTLSNDHGLDLIASGIESARATGSSTSNHADVLDEDYALELIGNWA